MHNKVSLLLISLILLILVFSCYLFFFRSVETDNAYITSDNIVLSSQVAGFVKEIKISNNQKVKKDSILIKIDDSEYQYAFNEAEASLEVKKSDLTNKKAVYGQQKIAIRRKKISEKIAFEDNAFSHQEYAKYKNLVDTGAISKSEFDAKKHNLETNKENLNASIIESNIEEENLSIIDSEIEQALSNIKIAQAAINKARYFLNKTVVQAPTDGKVADLAVRAGQYVAVGSKLLTLVPESNLYIVANFKETQLKKIKIGQLVKIKVDAFPSLSIIGIVDSISPATGAQFSLIPPDNATGNFTKVVQRVPVKIRFQNVPPKEFISGLSAKVELAE